MRISILAGAISMALFSCQNTTNSSGEHPSEQAGQNEFVGQIIQNDSSSVLFTATFGWDSLHIQNGPEETISLALSGRDTLKGSFPVFASDLWLVRTDTGYFGEFYRTDQENYRLPVRLYPGKLNYSKVQQSWPTQYKIERTYPDGSTKPALLQLSTERGILQGTIATATGDSRYLTGWETPTGFQLMGFDGRFIYNVVAHVQNEQIRGSIHAGAGGYYTFTGTADEQASLEDPHTMTQLSQDFTHIEFHLPAAEGQEDTLHFDSRTLTQPTVLTIQGSWCPNCMDEGKVLQEFYDQFNGQIQIIGLSFEYSGTLEKARKAVQKMRDDLNLSYPMTIATWNTEQDPNSILPLERIRSYPTSIILDRDGKVVQIHTGFYGPGTHQFERYKTDTRALLDELITQQ